MSQLKIKNGNNWESIPAGGIGVPSGGDAGDVLVKSSAVDYATEWYKPQWIKPPSYSTYTDITSVFPSRPTSGSTQTYTVPDDGYIYLFADSNNGFTVYISIDGTERFMIPAYNSPTAVTLVLPVAKDQVIRLYTNSTASTWSIRQVLYFQ